MAGKDFGKFEGEAVGRSMVRINGTVVLDRKLEVDEPIVVSVEATVGSVQFRHKQGVLERVHVGKMSRAAETDPEIRDQVIDSLARIEGEREGQSPLPVEPS